MNVTKTAAVALIALSGVAVPSAGAAHADGDPLLCGLLSPCDDDTGDDDAEPAPVDVDIDVDLDVDLDLDLDLDFGTPHPGSDLDTDVAGDVNADADLELFPSDGTLLVAQADLTSAALQANVRDHTVDAGAGALLDTDATVGRGVVVTAGGALGGAADVDAAGRQLVTADAANRLCGVQVVVAATSSADCRSRGSRSAVIGSGDGLIAVAESLDLCGAHVVVAGSASTDCGDPSASGSPGASSSWTLTDAVITGTVCGSSVAVAGESRTSCDSAKEAPVPAAGSNEPGTGRSGTGVSVGAGTNAGNPSGVAGTVAVGGGSASSPAAQPAQQTGDDGGAATADSAGSGSSLPLTGASVLLVLMVAAITLAAGLMAVRSSSVRSV